MEIGVPGGIGVLAQRHAGLVNKSEHGYVLSRKMEEILVSLMDLITCNNICSSSLATTSLNMSEESTTKTIPWHSCKVLKA